MLPFGIGAGVAAVLAFFDIEPLWQTLAFMAVSTLAFVGLRGFADKMTHEPPEKMGADRLLGKDGVVIEALTPNSPVGQVRVEREVWRAEAPGRDAVPIGTRVVVESIEGTHLMVRPLQD